jgi:dethiobiotin synthetase
VRGCLVTATDTGVGKTVLAAALAARLAERGCRVSVFKPVVTGLDEAVDGAPPDHELLAAAGGVDAARVSPFAFGVAASPHLAAELAGVSLERDALLAATRLAAEGSEALIVEGIGGLLVPFADDYSVLDYARDLGLPLLVASRPGLGTINHTRLTVDAARDAGLDVRAVVLTPWPARPDTIALSNAQTIARLCGVEVFRLPHVGRPEPELLARAADGLPVERWLDGAARSLERTAIGSDRERS